MILDLQNELKFKIIKMFDDETQRKLFSSRKKLQLNLENVEFDD